MITYNLLKDKQGLIFGALNELSIAWQVAKKFILKVLCINNVKATIRIYHDKMISGNILLPVLKKQILSLRITLEEKTLIPDYQS